MAVCGKFPHDLQVDVGPSASEQSDDLIVSRIPHIYSIDLERVQKEAHNALKETTIFLVPLSHLEELIANS